MASVVNHSVLSQSNSQLPVAGPQHDPESHAELFLVGQSSEEVDGLERRTGVLETRHSFRQALACGQIEGLFPVGFDLSGRPSCQRL